MKKSCSNKVIQSFWVGSELTIMEELCISSYLKQGHEFHLYTYNNIDFKNTPKGLRLLDANEVISFDRLFLDSRNRVASFADWFRYKLLYLKGGWWVDMDTVCLKYFDIPQAYCFATERSIYTESDILNIGYIKAQPKSPFLKDCIDYIEKQNHKKVLWGEFGSSLLSLMLSKYNYNEYIHPPLSFCPINWYETLSLINPQKESFNEGVFAVHLWNEMWTLNKLDKNASYHENSIYEQLKQKYIEARKVIPSNLV